MSEIGDVWDDIKEEQRKRRAERLPRRTTEILGLKALGYRVEELTPYHFRINGVLDLHPIHNRFHDLKSGRRGGYREAALFVSERIPREKEG